MIDILEKLAQESSSGDSYMSMAKIYLERNEWGLALQYAEEGLNRGNLSDMRAATRLFNEINTRLGCRTARDSVL